MMPKIPNKQNKSLWLPFNMDLTFLRENIAPWESGNNWSPWFHSSVIMLVGDTNTSVISFIDYEGVLQCEK